MAGNNSIQILRGTSDAISKSTDTLLDGQLLYDTDKNILYCGGGSVNREYVSKDPKQIKSMVPIYTDWYYVQNKPKTFRYYWGSVQSPGSAGNVTYSEMTFSVPGSKWKDDDHSLFRLDVSWEVQSVKGASTVFFSPYHTSGVGFTGGYWYRQCYEFLADSGTGYSYKCKVVVDDSHYYDTNPYTQITITAPSVAQKILYSWELSKLMIVSSK